MSRRQRVEKLRGHAASLLSAFLGLRLNYGILFPLLGDLGTPVAVPPQGQLWTGLSALRNTLFMACVTDVVKLAWDDDGRTPSITNIMRALDEAAVLAALREQQANAFMLTPEPADQEHSKALEAVVRHERQTRAQHFDHIHAKLVTTWRAFDVVSFKSAFRAIRDKHIAHLELRLVNGHYTPFDVASLGVRRADLATAIATMGELVVQVTAVVRDADFDMQRATQMFDTQGRMLWSWLHK